MSDVRKVAVVGGGIIGVSSALRTLDTVPGIQVTLISEKLSPHTTGDGSGGFWSPHLLGDVPTNIFRFWCEKTFQFLFDLYNSPDASDYGIGILSSYSLSQKPKEKPEYSDVFIQYRSMNEKELSMFPSEYKYGVFYTTLYAECKKLIPMLMKRFQEKGGNIIVKKVENLRELAGKFDVVINCPGVEAANLVPDFSVAPIRGQVIRVYAPWIKHAVNAGDFYILPNSEEVICGGTHQIGNWSREVDPVDSDIIWRGCTSLVPSLKKATILREWVGLRPGRPSPRIERETLNTENGKLEVVHNYGHGGSGVTLFWGCAIHAANLAQEALKDKENKSKL